MKGLCKHLVKKRFSVTRIRWRRAKIPNVVPRLALFNNEWDRYWGEQAA
jgi:hypothetical protein